MKIQFLSPEKLHMRPCAQIASFALNAEKEYPWIKLLISYSEKRVQATSIIALGLLWINKGDTFSVEVEWWKDEEVVRIIQSFWDLISTTLSLPKLHEARVEVLVPPEGLVKRWANEKHPNYIGYQERYNFLIRVKQFLEENKDYFLKTDSLTFEQQEKTRISVNSLAEEEKSMRNRRTIATQYWWIVQYLHKGHSSSQMWSEEYERVAWYLLPNAILEAQRYLGIIPVEVLLPIYHNINALRDLQEKLDSIDSSELLMNSCDATLNEMIKEEKVGTYSQMLHDFPAEYWYFESNIAGSMSEWDALERYKMGINQVISYWLEYVVTGFLNPD